MNDGGAKKRKNLTREETKSFRAWLNAICRKFSIERPSLAVTRAEKAMLSDTEVMSIALGRTLVVRLAQRLVPAHLTAAEWGLVQATDPVVWSLVSSPVYSAALTDAQLRARGRDPKIYKSYALSVGEIRQYYGSVDIAEFRRTHAPRVPMLIPSGLAASLARILVEMLHADDLLPKRGLKKASAALERRLLDMQVGCANAFAEYVGRMIDSKHLFKPMISEAKGTAKRIAPAQEMTMLLYALARLCDPDSDVTPSP